MTIVYIGLGSNLSEPKKQICLAVKAINAIAKSKIIKVSSLYFSRPMGPKDQPDYMNAVLKLDTELSALALLDALQAIENQAGRVRKDNRWGARILDLDIILFGQEIINNERLIIPHYGMKEREFVLIPLSQIAPDIILPSGEKVIELSKAIATNGLKIYQELINY